VLSLSPRRLAGHAPTPSWPSSVSAIAIHHPRWRFFALFTDYAQLSDAIHIHETFPKLQRFASKVGADIGFQDDAAVDLREHSGKTWGACGVRPQVVVSAQRGRRNVLSLVTAQGELTYHVTDGRIASKKYIEFLKQLMKGRQRLLIVIADRASFHRSRQVRIFVGRHRRQIRLHYLLTYSPERNPDEHVWEEIKDKKLRRQPTKNKRDLRKRLHVALQSLQHRIERVISFFHLPETEYAAQYECLDTILSGYSSAFTFANVVLTRKYSALKQAFLSPDCRCGPPFLLSAELRCCMP